MHSIRATTLAFSLCLATATSTAHAQEVQHYRLPQAARAALVELKLSVHHGHRGGDFTAELTASEVEKLRERGFEPQLLDHSDHAPEDAAWTSYEGMRADFAAYAAAYPNIAEFHIIGQSVQGRDIFGLRISDNVSVEENEPEVAFWACIHGDEFASGQIAFDWALDLLDDYGVDPVATGYVDSNEIWVFPLLNPDGYVLGRRSNVNNIDLNRDCGWQWDGWGRSPDAWSQVETQALDKFCRDNNITLSVTMHCSGNVFLYPWCSNPTNTPELTLIQQIGALYANAANYLLKNSWADYETHGEVIDVLYGSHGSLCYTAEISNSQALYNDSYARNKGGMDDFCSVAWKGLHGLVTDAQTGQPLRAAVYVSGSPYPAYTDPTVGDVHRIVVDGTYDVTVWANGYEPQTVNGITVAGGVSTPFQVALQRGGNEHAFYIQAVNQKDPNNSYANQTIPSDALGVPDGAACSLGRFGMIVLDMGEGQAITDGPGVDFTVTEAMVPGDLVQEGYLVFGGGPYDQSVLIGFAVGTASFDLAGTGLSSTRYLRIVDESGAPSNAPLAGMELDAVTILNGSGPRSLDVDVGQISLATGGTQNLSLEGPKAGELYAILGSITGTSPGFVLPASFTTMPLNVDAYFNMRASFPNALMQGSVGFLDGNGQAAASFDLPAGLSPVLTGLSFTHSFVLLDVTTFEPTFVSNTTAVTLVP